MQFLSISRIFALISLLLVPTFVSAHGFKLGTLEIGHPWTRATPNGAEVAGGFLKITNNGTEDDRLLSISVEGLARVGEGARARGDGVLDDEFARVGLRGRDDRPGRSHQAVAVR